MGPLGKSERRLDSRWYHGIIDTPLRCDNDTGSYLGNDIILRRCMLNKRYSVMFTTDFQTVQVKPYTYTHVKNICGIFALYYSFDYSVGLRAFIIKKLE